MHSRGVGCANGHTCSGDRAEYRVVLEQPLRALLLDCDGGGACDAVGVNLVRRQAEAGWHVAVRAEQAVHSRKWIARTDGLDSLCFVVSGARPYVVVLTSGHFFDVTMTAGIFFDLTLTKPNLACLSATRRQNFDAPVMKRVKMTTTAPRLFLAYATVTLTQICHITVVDGSFCYFTLWSSYLFHVPV